MADDPIQEMIDCKVKESLASCVAAPVAWDVFTSNAWPLGKTVYVQGTDEQTGLYKGVNDIGNLTVNGSLDHKIMCRSEVLALVNGTAGNQGSVTVGVGAPSGTGATNAVWIDGTNGRVYYWSDTSAAWVAAEDTRGHEVAGTIAQINVTGADTVANPKVSIVGSETLEAGRYVLQYNGTIFANAVNFASAAASATVRAFHDTGAGRVESVVSAVSRGNGTATSSQQDYTRNFTSSQLFTLSAPATVTYGLVATTDSATATELWVVRGSVATITKVN